MEYILILIILLIAVVIIKKLSADVDNIKKSNRF